LPPLSWSTAGPEGSRVGLIKYRAWLSLLGEVSRCYLNAFGGIDLTRGPDGSEPATSGRVPQEGAGKAFERKVYTWLDWAGCTMMAQGLSDLIKPALAMTILIGLWMSKV
jgi:hypothetical protein